MALGITRISVAGYKSIVEEQSIDIAPLTILAGANGSGKSSIMQPLLLLKQTLEAPYDAGPLLLNGPVVKFTSTDQFMSAECDGVRTLSIAIQTAHDAPWRYTIRKDPGKRLISHGSTARLFEDPYATPVKLELMDMVHVRGLRGNAERTYPITSGRDSFPGVFENYVASIVYDRNLYLSHELSFLNLGRSLRATAINEAELEVRIQTIANGAYFNVADVGFAVAQVLPVLVALLIAVPGRLVYIEQPELHLHPRAQTRMADILAAAAKRGVQVVVETHSSLLLTAIQTLIARKHLSPSDVRLHWFQLDGTGQTRVSTATLDENGAFGDWPEDFDDVILSTEKEYLDAVESRMAS